MTAMAIIRNQALEVARLEVQEARTASTTPASAPEQPAASPSPESVKPEQVVEEVKEVLPAVRELGAQWSEIVGSSEASATAQDEELSEARARYQALQDSMPNVVEVIEGESGSSTVERPPSAEERAAFAAGFVDSESGISAAEIIRRDQAAQAEKAVAERQQMRELAGERFAEASYGLNERDKELLARPDIDNLLARFREGAKVLNEASETQYRNAPRAAGMMQAHDRRVDAYVDPETGLSGQELLHVDRSRTEQARGDEATAKLENLKVGSFTGNESVQSVDASDVFRVIGRDERKALLEGEHSMLGKAYLLKDSGQLILPDEHETGVYFISNATVDQLRAGGVIDTENGGLNIDGLYLDGGNAHIGTTRPSGGLFGNVLNHVGKLLPGGKLGDIVSDAITDVNEFVNKPLLGALRAVGEVEDDFATQLVLHQQATVDTISHAEEHGNRTFDTLVKRTAPYGQVDQVANQVGQALIASGVLAPVGAAITIVSGATMAGHAQLAGDANADPNQGFTQAATSFLLAQASTGITQGVTDSLGTAVLGPGGVQTGVTANTASTFVSGTLNNATSQVLTTGELDVGKALVGGLTGAVGFNTPITPGVNAVQVVQLGDAILDGDAGRIATLGTGMVTSVVQANRTSPSEESPAQTGSEGSDSLVETTPDAAAARVTLSDAEVEEILRTADTGRSDPGPRLDVFPSETGELIVMTTDAEGRSQMTARVDGETGNQKVLQPDGSWATLGADNRPLSLERVDAKGSTVVIQFGEDGKATSQRTVLTNGVILDTKADSSMLTVQADAFGPAFAAARSAGVGVFSWNGKTYHTGTADQVNSIVDQFMNKNASALSTLSPEARLTVLAEATSAATNAFSERALSIANQNSANTAGLDGESLASGLVGALARGQSVQSGIDAETRLAQQNQVNGDRQADMGSSESGFFNEGATPAPRVAVQLDRESAEVKALTAQLDTQFGKVPPASEIRSWSQATGVMAAAEQRFNLTPEALARAARSAEYSAIGSQNQMPVHDFLLGSNDYSNVEFVAAVGFFQKHMPTTVPGPDGQQVRTGHVFPALNGLMNGNPVAASLMSHAGDAGQVLGAAVIRGGEAIGVDVLAAADLIRAAVVPGRSFSEAWSNAVAATQASGENLRRIVNDYAPSNQWQGNNLGWSLYLAYREQGSLSAAMASLGGAP